MHRLDCHCEPCADVRRAIEQRRQDELDALLHARIGAWYDLARRNGLSNADAWEYAIKVSREIDA
jgi:hypothetical protein